MEIALRHDGHSRQSLFSNRNEIRGYMFYPHGEPLKESTLDPYLAQFSTNIRQSTPYARIQKAIHDYDLFL